MDYERLYSYRFRDIDQAARAAVWEEIAPHVHGLMGSPQTRPRPGRRPRRVHRLDPGRRALGGRRGRLPGGAERPRASRSSPRGSWTPSCPSDHFDGVFASNFLEHLFDQEAICAVPRADARGDGAAAGGSRSWGRTIRYCAKEYWDCADHYVALTHVAIAEHLYAAGFEPSEIVPRYLPYSFRGILPPSPRTDPRSTCARRSPGGCSASSSW